jgi:hypothetical protein
VVVIGGGDKDNGMLDMTLWAPESTLWERTGGGGGGRSYCLAVSKCAARDDARDDTGVCILFIRPLVDFISVTCCG